MAIIKVCDRCHTQSPAYDNQRDGMVDVAKDWFKVVVIDWSLDIRSHDLLFCRECMTAIREVMKVDL